MTLPKIALIGAVLAGAIYVIAALVGLIAIGPAGIIGLVVLAFTGFLFLGVLQSRLSNKEDDYYEKNIKD